MVKLNRRDFLAGVGRAAIGASALVAATAAAQSARTASAARKTVRVGGRAVPVVDMHAHCIFPDVGRVAGANPAPTIIPEALTLGPHRLAAMDERGIDVQVLSINQYWWYSAERDEARRIVALHDEGLAAWCALHSERFVALTSVALQHPDLAAEQLEHAVTALGHRGASIGGHVLGESPSLPKYDPFWAKAEELGVPVFMHPNNAQNVVREGALTGRGGLDNIIGNPLETTLFLSRMIFDGTLDRFQGLKLCAAHGGGYLPSYLGRTEVACTVRDDAGCVNRRQPSEYLKDQIFVDSMVFSSEGLRHLVAETGVSQVVYGSDIPYFWPDTIDLIVDAPYLSDADKEAILGGNLIDMLRITA
jgi:aminocarboxymuconate-semialdehyde decarboxylase